MWPGGVVDIYSPLLSPATREETTDTKVCFLLALSFTGSYKGRGVEELLSICCLSVGSWETSWTEMVLWSSFASVIITFFLIGNTKEAWESVWLYLFILYKYFFLFSCMLEMIILWNCLICSRIYNWLLFLSVSGYI